MRNIQIKSEKNCFCCTHARTELCKFGLEYWTKMPKNGPHGPRIAQKNGKNHQPEWKQPKMTRNISETNQINPKGASQSSMRTTVRIVKQDDAELCKKKIGEQAVLHYPGHCSFSQVLRRKVCPRVAKSVCIFFCPEPSNVFAQSWQKYLHCTAKKMFALTPRNLHSILLFCSMVKVSCTKVSRVRCKNIWMSKSWNRTP